MQEWLVYTLLCRVLKRCFLVLFPVTVIGSHHVAERDAVIVAGNHISPLDGVYVWVSLRRDIFFLVVREVFLRPLVRIVLEWTGQIAVEENDRFSSSPYSGASALRAARDVLARGGAVGIHPEGYCCSDNQMDEFAPGVFWLALSTGTPVVPMGIRGSRHVLANMGGRPRLFTRVELAYGEPISVEGRPNTLANRQWLRRTLIERVAELSGQLPPPRHIAVLERMK